MIDYEFEISQVEYNKRERMTSYLEWTIIK